MMVSVTKDDVMPLIYFIVSMFQEENSHRQGTSSKSDYLGGYLDRWVNKLPESLLFNKILLQSKDFKVVNDYFIYGAGSDKNAPDILGLKANGQILKFSEFRDTTWVQIDDMPFIEVKTFRSNQKLVTIRETQLDNENYYIFAESSLRPDYLVSLFGENFFEIDFDLFQTDDCFIRSNSENLIYQPKIVEVPNDLVLGTISLITVIKGVDFLTKTVKCGPKEDVYYIKDIIEKDRVPGPNVDMTFLEMFSYNQERHIYETAWNDEKMIPLTATETDNIRIKKKNRASLYIETTGDCVIYDYELKGDRIYYIDVQKFERSSAWTEYIGLKNQYSGIADRRNELLELLERLYLDYLVN